MCMDSKFDYKLYHWFVEKLKDNKLYDLFIKDYGANFIAINNGLSGWWFQDDVIYYRCCELYNDWGCAVETQFCVDYLEYVINDILKRENYIIVYEGNDEGDFLVIWKKQ